MVDELTRQFWRELEDMGEENVRANLAKNVWRKERQPLVKEWLRQQGASKSAELEERKEASNEEQMRIARSAKNAAWTAAIAATIAAICAIISIIVALRKA